MLCIYFLQEVEKKFSEPDCLSFPFDFDDQRCLHLDVPREGVTIESGWRLSPLYDPMVRMFRAYCPIA